jgi:hypothetical protein
MYLLIILFSMNQKWEWGERKNRHSTYLHKLIDNTYQNQWATYQACCTCIVLLQNAASYKATRKDLVYVWYQCDFPKVTLCNFCKIMVSHRDSDILTVIPNIGLNSLV